MAYVSFCHMSFRLRFFSIAFSIPQNLNDSRWRRTRKEGGHQQGDLGDGDTLTSPMVFLFGGKEVGWSELSSCMKVFWSPMIEILYKSQGSSCRKNALVVEQCQRCFQLNNSSRLQWFDLFLSRSVPVLLCGMKISILGGSSQLVSS